MNEIQQAEKKALRKRMKEQLRSRWANLSTDEKFLAGSALAEKLSMLDEWQEAAVVCCFLSMPDEIETGPSIDLALKEGKLVFVPRIDGDDISFVPLEPVWRSWQRDAWNIPLPPARLEAVEPRYFLGHATLFLVPGLAFDNMNRRLGRGKGFYDRYIAGMDAHRKAEEIPGARMPYLVGVGLALQLVAEVPADDHDQRLDMVITV